MCTTITVGAGSGTGDQVGGPSLGSGAGTGTGTGGTGIRTLTNCTSCYAALDAEGVVTFQYVASDGLATSAPATVTITIASPMRTPEQILGEFEFHIDDFIGVGQLDAEAGAALLAETGQIAKALAAGDQTAALNQAVEVAGKKLDELVKNEKLTLAAANQLYRFAHDLLRALGAFMPASLLNLRIAINDFVALGLLDANLAKVLRNDIAKILRHLAKGDFIEASRKAGSLHNLVRDRAEDSGASQEIAGVIEAMIQSLIAETGAFQSAVCVNLKDVRGWIFITEDSPTWSVDFDDLGSNRGALGFWLSWVDTGKGGRRSGDIILRMFVEIMGEITIHRIDDPTETRDMQVIFEESVLFSRHQHPSGTWDHEHPIVQTRLDATELVRRFLLDLEAMPPRGWEIPDVGSGFEVNSIFDIHPNDGVIFDVKGFAENIGKSGIIVRDSVDSGGRLFEDPLTAPLQRMRIQYADLDSPGEVCANE